jgi:hypothetical protein
MLTTWHDPEPEESILHVDNHHSTIHFNTVLTSNFFPSNLSTKILSVFIPYAHKNSWIHKIAQIQQALRVSYVS